MATVTKPHCGDDPSDSPLETHSFTLLLSGFDKLTDEIEQAIYNGGCDDALLGIAEGQPYLSFDRQSTSLLAAIHSAMRDVERTNLGIRVIQVVPPGEHIISLFNALLKLRNDRPDLAGMGPEFSSLVDSIFKKLAQ